MSRYTIRQHILESLEMAEHSAKHLWNFWPKGKPPPKDIRSLYRQLRRMEAEGLLEAERAWQAKTLWRLK